MVLQKTLDNGINDYQVPPMPHVPKSAKGKRSVRKKTKDNRMCAFDLLAAVAGKLLLEGESSSEPIKLIGTPNPISGTNIIKRELENDEKLIKQEARDLGSCSRSMLGSDFLVQRKIIHAVKSVSVGPAHDFTKSDASNKEGYKERKNSSINKRDNDKVEDDSCSNRNAFIACTSGHKMDIDDKPQCLVTPNRSIKVPLCADRIENSFFSSYRDKKLLVDRDDDENFSGSNNPGFTANKALKQQGIAPLRIRKQAATRFWKVATTITKDSELPSTDGEVKRSFHSRKICYTRRRTQRSSFKRRKLFQHCSVFSSNGRINNEENRVTSTSISGHLTSYVSEDFHVKLRIKSFKVPELFIEIPETSTVGSLKRTVVEAVTAILGGGLRVGVVLQGKNVRDDNKTLIQAGISHDNKLEDLGFTLEPNSNLSLPELPLLASPEEPHLLLPCEVAEPLNRFPVVVPSSDGKPDVSQESHLTPVNCLESDLSLIPSPIDTLSFDKTADCVRPLITIPSMSVEAIPIVPVHKAKRSDFAQRRIRRPFSVSEVEALVQAVEKLGTGRWRDVKIRAFDNAKHRTYVDLKDKWKTLVHTARISPQQRRGEPVPQVLLDRVLSAHAYWTQQQAKLQSKSPQKEACL